MDTRKLVDWVYLLEGMTRKKRQEMLAWFTLHHPDIQLPTIWRIQAKLEKLTGIKPVWYHCCKNSCMAYTGEFSDLEACLECSTPRYNTQTLTRESKPLKKWLFIPLIPRLKHQFSTKYAAELSTYRAQFQLQSTNETVVSKDIFNGRIYQDLLRTGVFKR